jgi:hypothetical protein
MLQRCHQLKSVRWWPDVVSLISLLAGRFYRHFYRTRYVEGFYAGIYFTYQDDAGIGHLLAIIPIIASHIWSGRPITYVPDLIRVRPFPPSKVLAAADHIFLCGTNRPL